MKKNSGNFYKNMLQYIYKLKKRDKYRIEVEKKRLVEKINEIWGDTTCPICQKHDWTTSGEIYTPSLINEQGRIDLGKKMLPLMPITCSNCGNTLFINGKVLGCIHETNDNTKDVSEE